MIRFAAPYLLALGCVAVLVTLVRLRSLPRSHQGPRRRVIQALMALSVIAAALAVGRLEIGRRLDRMAVIFVVDRSRSADGGDDPMALVNRSLEEMETDDRAGLVVFAAEAATEVAPSPRPAFGVSRASIPRDATDIGAGIRRALADLPAEHAARIVVLSDGVETRGDALGAATLAAGRGVPVDVVAVERPARSEVAVERVRLPSVADPDQPIELRVVTRATSATRVRVRVRRDGVPLAEGEADIREGNDVLTLREIAPSPGVHRYEVLLEPLDQSADGAAENNEGGAIVRVSGGSRALVLSDRPEEATAFASALRSAGFEVVVGGPVRVPADLAELASFDLLVLSDLSSRAFDEAQMRMVASYVNNLGGGLLMAGTRDAFGLGGYAFTPIEEVLPATFDLRRRRDRASLAMVIAIDNSGSMGVEAVPGTTKLDLANEAAARSALLLSPRDHVGVAHVDTAVSWTQPMTIVEDPGRIAARVRQAQPGGGGIYVDLTLEASYEVLRGQSTQLKHLLLFSDGEDSEEMRQARRLVTAAAGEGITTSIVSMGSGIDTPELERLSRAGGGRFYIVEDLTELPRIFTQETIEASRSAIVDEAFRVLPGPPSEITRGVDFSGAPALGGYSVVNARPRATALLSATEEDPLLLVHQAGVGRTAVFVCDLGAGFARPWLAWEGYAALFGQLGRGLARSAERRDANVAVTVENGTGHIRVEAVDADGRTQNDLDLSATVAAPGGRSQEVALTQTAAGRYVASFDADAPGAYLVSVRERGEGLVGSAGVVRARGDELRGEGTDHAKLAQIAALTGGEVRADLDDLFVDRPEAIYAYAPAWRELLMLAMLALLASVAARRLTFPSRKKATQTDDAERPLADSARASASADRSVAPQAPIADDGEGLEAPAGESAAEQADAPASEAEPSTLAETLLARRRRKK